MIVMNKTATMKAFISSEILTFPQIPSPVRPPEPAEELDDLPPPPPPLFRNL
jgi:hypothetical protein